MCNVIYRAVVGLLCWVLLYTGLSNAVVPMAFRAAVDLTFVAQTDVRSAVADFLHDTDPNISNIAGMYAPNPISPHDARMEILAFNSVDLAPTLAAFAAALLPGVPQPTHCSTLAITRVYDTTPAGVAGSVFTFVSDICDTLFLSGMNFAGPPPFLIIPLAPVIAPGIVVPHPAQWGTGANFAFAAARPSVAPGLFSHSENAIDQFIHNMALPGVALGVPDAVIVNIQNIRSSCQACYNVLANSPIGTASFLSTRPDGFGTAPVGPVPVSISVSHDVVIQVSSEVDIYKRKRA